MSEAECMKAVFQTPVWHQQVWMIGESNTLCLKNVPPSTCYNLDIHDPITIIFGRIVTEKVRN